MDAVVKPSARLSTLPLRSNFFVVDSDLHRVSDAPLLALTPVSPFRPRRWRGALLPDTAQVGIEVLEADKRPVAAVADHDEVRDVRSVEVSMDPKIAIPMLFDPGHSLDERILREQFGY